MAPGHVDLKHSHGLVCRHAIGGEGHNSRSQHHPLRRVTPPDEPVEPHPLNFRYSQVSLHRAKS